MANNPPPDPVDSGFDDPEQFIKTERQLFSELEKSREKARKDLLALNAGRGIDDEINRIFAPLPSLKPWPLAFTIFGLGLIFTIIVILLSGCAQTSIQARNFTMKTQANMSVCDVKADGSFRIEGLNHSTPTLAGGKAFSNGTATVGSAATGLAAGLLSHGGL